MSRIHDPKLEIDRRHTLEEIWFTSRTLQARAQARALRRMARACARLLAAARDRLPPGTLHRGRAP